MTSRAAANDIWQSGQQRLSPKVEEKPEDPAISKEYLVGTRRQGGPCESVRPPASKYIAASLCMPIG